VALEKALAVDPKHAKSHNNLALAAIDVGELELAEAHYRDSLEIQPQPAIYNDLGVVLERQGLSDEAVRAYRKAIELDPKFASAHYNLGSSLARSGQLAEAERYLRKALDADPTSAAAHQQLAQVLTGLGRTDEARRENEKAQALAAAKH
jgi:superkiller protein 3